METLGIRDRILIESSELQLVTVLRGVAPSSPTYSTFLKRHKILPAPIGFRSILLRLLLEAPYNIASTNRLQVDLIKKINKYQRESHMVTSFLDLLGFYRCRSRDSSRGPGLEL